MAERFWLGYDGLDVALDEIVAVLVYRRVYDAAIAQTWGSVPRGVQAVVVTVSGDHWPARWAVVMVHQRWVQWRNAQGGGDGSDRDCSGNHG